MGKIWTNTTPANPANDQERFATYTRDSATGLDYAYQRHYRTSNGRFLTPGPLAMTLRTRRIFQPNFTKTASFAKGNR